MGVKHGLWYQGKNILRVYENGVLRAVSGTSEWAFYLRMEAESSLRNPVLNKEFYDG
jgi:hypothetical protein